VDEAVHKTQSRVRNIAGSRSPAALVTISRHTLTTKGTMQRLAFLGTLTSIVCALTFAHVSSSEAADACARKDFKTTLVKQACQQGGQKAAKDAMKAFNKENKIKSCNQCHAKLAPSYELKADGYEQFVKLGGK
jgi:hypothetical protein